MASQALLAWASPAAALPFGFAAVAAVGAGWPSPVPFIFLAAGVVAALFASAWATRRGLRPEGAPVAGFTAGLVLAVGALLVLITTGGPCGATSCLGDVSAAVVAGVVALGTMVGAVWVAKRAA